VEATVGEIVNFPAALEDNQEFIADCCRFAEGILDEKIVRKKYRLAESVWESLGSDDVLVAAIELEKTRRVRDGSAKREKAQKLVVQAPDVLSGILMDNSANARHRIDSAKVLNDFAANGPEGIPAADRFQITIVLDSDTTLKFDKSRAVDANDIDPYNDTGVIAAIAAKKDDGGGQEFI
jgi:hypothetical protein